MATKNKNGYGFRAGSGFERNNRRDFHSGLPVQSGFYVFRMDVEPG